MKIFNKIKELVKKLGIKYIILCMVIFVFILALIIYFEAKHRKTTSYDEDNVYPSEVKEIYRYIVDANCNGDLKFDIILDGGVVTVDKLEKNNLLDYMFNYLDKRGYLRDSMDISIFNEAIDKIFLGDIKLLEGITTYDYKDFSYTFKNNKVTRVSKKCNSDITYVANLYGYSSREKTLSIDINVGYLKDNIMYDLDGKELGEFDNNKTELFKYSPYYRIYYVKENDDYKLSKVDYVNKK